MRQLIMTDEIIGYCHYYCPHCKESKDCKVYDMVVICNECLAIVQYTNNLPKNLIVKKR